MTNSPNASITFPAASGPSWPLTRTSLVDATFSPSLSIVASNKMAGKAEKSRGLELLIAIMIMTTPNKILKVKRKSSKNEGRGSTSIEIINRTMTGIPSPDSSIFDIS